MAHRPNGQGVDPGTRAILEELRDLRVEQRRADDEHRQERRRSDARFEQLIREIRQDSARREAMTLKALKNVNTVGVTIVKAIDRNSRILERNTRILEHHGQLLERIDRKLDPRWNGGRPGRGNGRTS